MAKKGKPRKKRYKKQLKIELLGLLFVFLAIFGSGASAISDGAIPNILENIFRFFFGIWYFVASLALLVTGIILLVKRKYPNFINKKMIGFYIGFLGILLLTHIQTFEQLLMTTENSSIIKLTWTNFLSYIRGQATASQIGGGFIGGILFTFSYYLFSSIGAKIVAVFSLIIGLLFMTELSLGDFFIKVWKKLMTMYHQQLKKIKQRRKDKQDKKGTEVSIESSNIPPVSSTEEEQDPVIEEFTEIAYSFDQAKESQPPKVEKTSEEVDDVDDIDEVVINTTAIQAVEHIDYKLPSLNLLQEPIHNTQQHEKSAIQATVRTLEKTFQSFGVKAKVTKVHVGPAVTKYEISPESGVKVKTIVNLDDDLALALAAQDIRIEAPIPGKSAVGIEIPNKEVAMVSLREVLDAKSSENSKLLFALGRDISGDAVVGELNKMPHLLIAGATGSGKSVCINGIITTILMRAKPQEVKMMMIDPKRVELNMYNGIPHLLTPVVTEPKKASQALKKVVAEMERRYELLSETGMRNIEGYNAYIQKNNDNEEELPDMPYIVVIVDELADLMMVASKDVEDSITRLAQKARAAGIHLIIATQRPSVDVITGVIKANIPSRIAFSVSSHIDSRTILDTGGAEKLLGRGDMLYIPVGQSKPTRVQGAFLSDGEVERIVAHCVDQQPVVYQDDMTPSEVSESSTEVDDKLYGDAVQLVTDMQTASVSMLQRRFRIGYTRAARLIDAMEDRGIVGPYEGSKPRVVLVSETSEEVTS